MSASQIHFCTLCRKPFVSESLRDRHHRYCSHRVRKRPRSCKACNAAKTKCSFEDPCTRCVNKRIKCTYNLRPPPSSPGDVNTTETNSSFSYLEGASFECLSKINQKQQPSIPESTASCQEVLTPPKMYNVVSLNEFNYDDLVPFTEQLWAVSAPISSDVMSSHPKTDGSYPAWCSWMQQDVSIALMAVDGTVALTSDGITTFHKDQPHAYHNANIIIQSLRSLPLMMRRRETFPWFIHTQSQLLNRSDTDSLPDSLLQCMSIAQMYALRTKETKSLLWRSIRIECQRLGSIIDQMSNSELLAAVQACMIYLIMFIVDHLLGDQDDGHVLLSTIYDLYIMFKRNTMGCVGIGEFFNDDLSWEDWIMAESQRRLASLWFLVGCVVCVKNGISCDTTQSFRNIPMPRPKSLWEASTRTSWELEYEESQKDSSRDFTTIGDLIDAQRSHYVPSSARKLDRWNAGADGLSSLLNLVSEMV